MSVGLGDENNFSLNILYGDAYVYVNRTEYKLVLDNSRVGRHSKYLLRAITSMSSYLDVNYSHNRDSFDVSTCMFREPYSDLPQPSFP
jgi:hypothetical protein